MNQVMKDINDGNLTIQILILKKFKEHNKFKVKI